ncbi:hypothetical protein [Streptomyces rapamycinicus]|uniref:Uncharacterized protein n=2 Tax=Streptomyces rapamycinicus TaxID=1226757 RepID=A0A0A0NQN8_STRRN|nr:hypothetical protein [Streptomyces rapamycinicus]AGP56800.1 hypothetical protein M271_26625 [Streptomyces rapamycinicus NRRL 5491]MBB4784412.1 hypothetical protein [Streptomyces rapamycinicus]RLV80104.1 hypothetical protein D3C57_117005 [Streptomyces rapamycinicus NRRL 5491]UTO64725.1 hypothetical protein LJB45_21940 [Streptomyces rapamycinicus]UTP32682.1 hypothetical protein LIV37_27065 [Streptomyces rapamycinicus NRRL 5491]
MRDAIAHILLWVLHLFVPQTRRRGPGRHSAEHFATVTAMSPAPHRHQPWTGPSSEDARAIFRADVSHLTPEQRERHWAAAFAEIGVEYPYRYEGDHFAALAASA